MKKRFLLLVIFVLLFYTRSVLALSVTPTISCDKDSVDVDGEVTCDVNVSVDDTINSITASVSVSSNLELTTPSILGITNEEGVSGNINIGTVKVTALSSGSATITIENIKVDDDDFSSITKGIEVLSEEIYLDSLSIEDEVLSPEFDKDVLEYSLTTKKESITINATSSSGDVSGAGSKTLKVGNNKIQITVSKGNLSKTYTINVTREEEKQYDTTLKKITLSSGSINFKPNVYEYNITLDASTYNIKITAEPTDSNSKVKFSPNSTISLDNGETKTVTITVSADGGEETVYTLNITRKEKEKESSDGTKLKSLTIKGVTFKFSPNTLTYNITVENDITHADISYETEDSDSAVDITGNTTLKVGLNTIKVVVTSKSGKTKTYTLNITRNKSKVVLSNNEEEIINKINDSEDDSDIYVSIDIDDEKEISENILEALSNSKKTLVYEINKNDKLVYSVMFSGKYSSKKPFNYEILFKNENEENLTKLVGSNMYLPITFKTTDKMPGELLYKIYTGDKTIKDLKKLNLYKFDASSGELELVDKNLKVEDGYVEIKLSETAEYILAYMEPEKIKLNENIIIPAVLLPVLLVAVIVGLIVQKKKKKA